MAIVDLWPENIQFVREEFKAPVAVLEEQAAFLGQRTLDIVTAKVSHHRRDTAAFTFFFHIVGPAISFYQWRLLVMSHNVPQYPLTLEVAPGVLAPQQSVVLTIKSHDEFLRALRRIFSADKTLRVIRAILALSGAEPDEHPAETGTAKVGDRVRIVASRPRTYEQPFTGREGTVVSYVGHSPGLVVRFENGQREPFYDDELQIIPHQ